MKKRAFIFVVISGILWGTSGVFFNLLKPFGFTPLQMTAMRGFISSVVLILYVLLHNKTLFRISAKELILFVFNGLCIYGAAASYYSAIKFSTVSTAVTLMYTAPVFVLIYSVKFLGEKLNTLKIISVIMLIVGCALVSGIVGGVSFNITGIILGISAGIFYSAYNVLAKIAMMRKYNSLSTTLYSFITMGIVAVAFSNPCELIQIAGTAPLKTIPLIVGIGVFTCVVPYFIYTVALRDIDAGTASALGIIEPMAATVFSIVFFSEKPGLPAICGIILVLSAVFLINKNESK